MLPTRCGYREFKAGSEPPRSRPRNALRVRVDRIERGVGCHEQAVASQPAETEIGTALRQQDMGDQITVRGEHNNAVEPRTLA